jgi:hypothetical protein
VDRPYRAAGKKELSRRPFSTQILGETMCRITQGRPWLVAIALGLLLAGCARYSEVRYAETGATLEGTVSYGKEKIGVALVVAQNSSGAATAFIDDDGRYRLTNVPLGEVNLGVNTDAGKGQAMGKAMAAAQGKAKAPPRIVEVPIRFADPNTSGLKTTISAGANTFEIVIPR